jgi:hypothetical protein
MGPPDFDVFDTLRRLLPAGGSIRDTETQAGYAGITIVDAAGTTRVDVNVQLDTAGHVEPLFDCATRHVPGGTQCTVVTRPDGTRMLTADGPDAEGPTAIEERQVDVLYPDGRRVVVIEWNAADEQRGPTTRPTPLFALNQLITLATAPDWRK